MFCPQDLMDITNTNAAKVHYKKEITPYRRLRLCHCRNVSEHGSANMPTHSWYVIN